MHTLLSQVLRDCDQNALWIADENSKTLLVSGIQFAGKLLSNRWDVVRAAEALGISARFNDFELASSGEKYSRIVYPVSKEKAAVHHVINSAVETLLDGGELLLLGEKSSGIKTYAQKAAARLGCVKQLQKHGNDYLSINRLYEANTGAALDDSNYTSLRQPDALGGLWSKPGLFGWNKIDVGSALLASELREFLPTDKNTEVRIVDLGCGYGYLSAQAVALATAPEQLHIRASDNNAAAILTCRENFQALNIHGSVSAGDAGSEIESSSADFLICNPPFHQGFQVEGDLTERFLQQAARILRAGGQALFVVNEFIPVSRKAEGIFQKVEPLSREKGFCVYRLSK
ncbi:class I SAM-dependent methyltransferase [Microbulbifer pacificus]|uniref:Methyltransferase n=1 Tax=Microbulbifer pacificus TaxID=407164 RepID=A0AAU0MYZ7_9GAMM|nr:methyltransferase [Microbulbifer pacificus]WOX05431.1 methyltransferase [Microbulbifer pacificus]